LPRKIEALSTEPTLADKGGLQTWKRLLLSIYFAILNNKSKYLRDHRTGIIWGYGKKLLP